MSFRSVLWPLLAVALLVPGVAQSAPGDPYVVYTANSFADGAVVLRTDPATGTLEEISRNGPNGGLFERPFDLALEADGHIVVADLGAPCTADLPSCENDGRIVRVDPVGGRQTLVASGAPLLDPAAIAVAPGGAIYVADNYGPDGDGAVIRVDPATGEQTVVTSSGLLDLPFGILVDRDGSLVVSNRAEPGGGCSGMPGHLVRVQVPDGRQQLVAGGLLDHPLGIALDAEGRIAFANECGPDGIVRLIAGGAGAITANGPTDLLVTPERLALDPAGDFVVSDYSTGDGDGGVVSVDSETGAQTIVHQGDLFNHPLGIATVVNRPPTAALASAPAVAAGKPARLDASGSSDPEALRLAYEWDLDGDGAYELGSGRAAVISRSWSLDGPVTVGLRVNDPHGGRAVLQRAIVIDGSMPVLTRLRASAGVIARSTRDGRDGLPSATRIQFDLSERGRVRIDVLRAQRGRRPRRKAVCRLHARRGRACVRLSRVRVMSRRGVAGDNTVVIRASSLSPGHYRIVVRARDRVGNPATPRSLALRVVRASG